MSLKNSQYDMLMREYNRRQLNNFHQQQKRIEQAYQMAPELKQIAEKLSSLSAQRARDLINGNPKQADLVRSQISSLKKRRLTILSAHGLPSDYMDLHYHCSDCKDTGYINGKKCHCFQQAAVDLLYDQSNLKEILQVFGIEDLLPKKLIFLSSGELRKFLIVRTLLNRPKILVLDNPFIGLDAPSRDILVEMLEQLTHLHGVQVILLLSNPNDIPGMITDVLPISDRVCFPARKREEFLADSAFIQKLFPNGNGGVAVNATRLVVKALELRIIDLDNLMPDDD